MTPSGGCHGGRGGGCSGGCSGRVGFVGGANEVIIHSRYCAPFIKLSTEFKMRSNWNLTIPTSMITPY